MPERPHKGLWENAASVLRAAPFPSQHTPRPENKGPPRCEQQSSPVAGHMALTLTDTPPPLCPGQGLAPLLTPPLPNYHLGGSLAD